MSTTLNKLEYIDETKKQIKNALNTKFNSQIEDSDTFRSYVEKINDIYTNWPKVSGNGENITLNNTKVAKMLLEIKGNTVQDGTPTPENPVEIKNVKGRDLFDKNRVLSGYEFTDASGNIGVNADWFLSDYIEVTPNSQYYLEKTYGSQNIFYDSSKNFVTNLAQANGVITIPNNDNIKYIRFNNRISDMDNTHFVKGTEAIPYNTVQIKVQNSDNTQSQIVNFPLSEGQYLAEGGYLADNGIHNVKNKIKITGNDIYSTSYSGLFYMPLSNYIGLDAYCNYFKTSKVNAAGDGNANVNIPDLQFNMRNGSAPNRVYFKNTNWLSTADATTFFDNNDVYLEYELKPDNYIITPYTQEQQQAWEQIKALRSYADVTHINSSNIPSPIFTVNALKKGGN